MQTRMTIRRMLTPRYQNGKYFSQRYFPESNKWQVKHPQCQDISEHIDPIAPFEENEWAMVTGSRTPAAGKLIRSMLTPLRSFFREK
jgi:hypothetical protein